MNLNLKRHKTLEVLSIKRIQFDSGQIDSGFTLGVSFEELQSELKSDREKCEIIFAPLYNENEVEYTDVGVKGICLTQKGLTSFSNKKYVKENKKIILNWFKNFVQIAIPVLSLIVAILVIIKDDIKTSKEIRAIEQKVELLQDNIKLLEENLQSNFHQNTDIH
jgi:hypothetical protein